MNIAQLLVWASVAPQLISAGIATEQQIVQMIKLMHGTQMTEPELNTIIALVIAGAAKHKALADLDAASSTAAA
jgi:uncharacterized membrane protein YidH (DUF202 family)